MTAPQPRPIDYTHLAVIYIVWGTVYLGLKIGVNGPGSFTPFQMQAARLLLGGGVLAAIAWAQGRFGGFDRAVWIGCAISAAMFWIGGNGLTIVAVKELPSSFVAMAMGTIPIWSAVLHLARERRVPSAPLPLLLGFVGLVLIFWPAFGNSSSLGQASIWAIAALFIAPITWVVGTAMQPALLRKVDGLALAAVQLLMGSALALGVTLFEGVAWPGPPSSNAILALLFSGLFGSALAFSSYIAATQLFSRPVVAAFAYVNPAVGLVAGWLILGEWPELISLLGTVVVTLSVILTLRTSEAKVAHKHR